MKFNVDAIALQAMTFKDAITKAFNDDWNSRRIAYQQENQGDVFLCRITLSIECPMEDAKKVLHELLEKEKRNEAT